MTGALAFITAFWLLMFFIVLIQEIQAEGRDKKNGQEFYSPDSNRFAGWAMILYAVVLVCVAADLIVGVGGEIMVIFALISLFMALVCLAFGFEYLTKERKIRYPKGKAPVNTAASAKQAGRPGPKSAPEAAKKPAAAPPPAPGQGQAPSLFCSNCGEVIEPHHQFCPSCGAVLKKKEQKALKICSNCGEKVEDGQIFCPYCGKRM